MFAAIQLLLVTLVVLSVVAGAVWGISSDSSERPPAASELILVVGGTRLTFRVVPLDNCHRVHGRHRAG